MPESVLTVLKYGFLALLYLFLWRVVTVVMREMRGTTDAEAPARRTGRERGARLRIIDPPEHAGEVFPLADEITVGRGAGCGIVLPDDHYVSTVHARVFRRGGDVFVEDLESRNGTLVNGEAVVAVTRLRRGDRVQFGQTTAELVR